MKAATAAGVALAVVTAGAVMAFVVLKPASQTPHAEETRSTLPRQAVNGLFPDIDFALAELCYPFLLEKAEASDIMRRTAMSGNAIEDADSRRIIVKGVEPDSFMSLSVFPGSRGCIVSIPAPDAETMRKAALARFAKWPVELKPATIPGISENGASAFCATHPDGGYDIATVGPPNDNKGIVVAMMRNSAGQSAPCTIPQ